MDTARIKTEFGLRLRAFRQSKKHNLEEFGEIIGLNFVNLSNIENGKTYPDFMTLCSIIEKGGASPDYLLDFLKCGEMEYDAEDFKIMKHFLKLTKKQKKALIDFMSEMK